MNISFDAVYYEPSVLSYPLGQQLKEKYADLPWQEIESHNHIQQFRNAQNSEFPKLKRNLIIGTRKTHKYTENHKVSDFLVPYTSSGCSAMCLYEIPEYCLDDAQEAEENCPVSVISIFE